MKDDLEAMEGPGGSQASLPCLPFGSITPEPEADTFVGRWGLCEGGSASFLEGMGAGIVVGRGGGIYSVTSRALDILGCSCKEAASRSFYDFIDPEDRPPVVEIGEKLGRGQPVPRRYHYRVVNKRGQVRWVENFSVAIDWDGEKAGLNFLTDITDRKAAEGELHWHRDQLNEMVREWGDEMAVAEQELERTLFGQLQAEQELRIRDLALKSAVNAIALGDLDGNLVYVNPSCLKLWGCQDETEVLGRPICQFWADEGRARAVFEELVQSGSWEGEMKGRRKDGTAFDGFLAASLVRDELGHPICTMGWYVDITRQKAAQEQLLMYQDQLRSLACELAMTQLRERRRIAGQLHDRIGQTLCLSKMKLERIQESARTSQAGAALNEVAEEIKNVIANLRSLITDLNPPILSELGLVSGLAWLAEGLESEHGLRVRLFDDGRPKPLSEDMRDLLFQAARELAMNSIRHGRSTSLRIDLKTADDKITIVFQDDGIGFDLDTLRPASVNNKGLGIFGIRERLAGRGGGLVVESMPGLGTRVVLTAPLTG